MRRTTSKKREKKAETRPGESTRGGEGAPISSVLIASRSCGASIARADEPAVDAVRLSSGSFVTQSLDGSEPRGFDGREDSGDQSRQRRDREAGDDEPGRDERRQERERVDAV